MQPVGESFRRRLRNFPSIVLFMEIIFRLIVQQLTGSIAGLKKHYTQQHLISLRLNSPMKLVLKVWNAYPKWVLKCM